MRNLATMRAKRTPEAQGSRRVVRWFEILVFAGYTAGLFSFGMDALRADGGAPASLLPQLVHAVVVCCALTLLVDSIAAPLTLDERLRRASQRTRGRGPRTPEPIYREPSGPVAVQPPDTLFLGVPCSKITYDAFQPQPTNG